MAMLPDKVKDKIQAAYRQMLESHELTPRSGQRQMIAEIVNCLAEIDVNADKPAPVCAVEAGTGTGKTLAYLLAVLPLAKALELKVVIATATVALQEQVLHKDIPELMDGSDLQFSTALAKGRGRYLCLTQLDAVLSGGLSGKSGDESEEMQMFMDLYADNPEQAGPDSLKLYQDMQEALASKDWQGDRDEWKSPLADSDWQRVTIDNARCMGPKCSNFSRCCFYQARNEVEQADCIVANQDLLLSDLALGGGAILTEPEQTIYIIDEAHHLPQKSSNHFAAFTQIKSTLIWLERLEKMGKGLTQDQFTNAEQQGQLQSAINNLRVQVQEAWSLLQQIIDAADESDSYNNIVQHAFSHGVIPDELRTTAQNMTSGLTRLATFLQQASTDLKSTIDEATEATRQLKAERWFPVVWSMSKRAQASLDLWRSFAEPDEPDVAPTARWLRLLTVAGEADITLSSAPVLAARNLDECLWQRCAAAVLTSATLTALGSFDTLILRAGLPEHSHLLRIPSPFPFFEAASFQVPRLHCTPRDKEKHTALIVRAIPRLLAKDEAALMLFSSRRQMRDVLVGLPEEWQERVLCQDDYQKMQLLKYHRRRVDEGEGSVIFGLASFAEGVDLPGKYCTHVLIAKIPFAVPNNPLEATLADWIEGQGKNAFMSLAVPDAAFRLVQASGRLLRNEQDTGCITLFDERIVNKPYGRAMLDSLPPYRRELLTLDLTTESG
ncbi:MAG: ATP-dependent DNA helicase DinG [Pseudohongiellaceae bacterium]